MKIIAVLVGLFILGRIVFTFLKDVNKSKNDFQGKPMKIVFSEIIEYFNHGVFKGNIKIIENNLLNITLIHNVSSQHKVTMQYIQGDLAIDWCWKHMQKELIHKSMIRNILTLNDIEIHKHITEISNEMAYKMKEHANKVNR